MLANMLIPPTLFFALGFIANLVRSDLKFPADVGKAAFGVPADRHRPARWHGDGQGRSRCGAGGDRGRLRARHRHPARGLRRPARSARASTGRTRPLIAAHYGSVSAGTFLTAVAFLEAQGVAYETYPLIMLAIMESPAIIIGLAARAARARRRARPRSAGAAAAARGVHQRQRRAAVRLDRHRRAGHTPRASAKILPLFDDPVHGACCALFLLEMGLEARAARRRVPARRPVPDRLRRGRCRWSRGCAGALVGHCAARLRRGRHRMPVAVLAASASYIAVPWPAARPGDPRRPIAARSTSTPCSARRGLSVQRRDRHHASTTRPRAGWPAPEAPRERRDRPP
ncbi:MAG: sodium-dependent bicarbonate transport family permease [Chromatiales bacterium]|nr:sodium-dependent bicarbonate transport family permease [Chromatiales bacterium]